MLIVRFWLGIIKTVRSILEQSRPGPLVLSSWQQIALIALRTLIGWHFLYEGYYKLALPGWSADGAPIAAVEFERLSSSGHRTLRCARAPRRRGRVDAVDRQYSQDRSHTDRALSDPGLCNKVGLRCRVSSTFPLLSRGDSSCGNSGSGE